MNDNVCIIVIDAARASNFSCYGHSRETTPNIDAVAEEGLVFERAVSPAGATRESTASLFSGKYPTEHQARLGNNIPVDTPLLPELFKRSGYRTGAVTTNPFITPGFGFETGVDDFESIEHRFDKGMDVRKFFSGVKDRPNPEICFRFLLEALDRNFPYHVGNALQFRFDIFTRTDQGGRQATKRAQRFVTDSNPAYESNSPPWFLYLHYTEPHMKNVKHIYKVPKAARYRYVKKEAADTANLTRTKDDDDPYLAQEVHERLYDGALFYDDFYIGQLVDTLKSSGQWDDTLFVVMADHGESLGENGQVGHGFISEPSVHVPLIIKPGDESLQSVDRHQRVNTMGLFNTFANLLNEPTYGSVSDVLTEPEETVLVQDYSGNWAWSDDSSNEIIGVHALYQNGVKAVKRNNEITVYDTDAKLGERAQVRDERKVNESSAELARTLSKLPSLSQRDSELSVDVGTKTRLEDLGYL